MRRLVLLLVILCTGLAPARAQDRTEELPQWQSTTVNDFAGLLMPEDAQTIEQALTALRDETGIEGTVVTLPDRTRFGGAKGLEPFASYLAQGPGTITLGGTPTVTNGSLVRLSSGNTAAATYTPSAAMWALSGADVTGTFTSSAIVPF